MYQKEILYLYLFRHGVEENCVGFLKSEEKRDGHLVSLQLKNISGSIAGTFPIRIRGSQGWQEIGQVQVHRGCGNWQQKGTESFAEIEIPLSDEYKVRGQSKVQSDKQSVVQADSSIKRQNIVQAHNPIKEQSNVQIAPQETEPKLKAASDSYPILWEDKWEQLLHSYDQIHPYGDGRTYIKLEPKDFTVLRSGYQHLVNNSFLLHGFYNYRYLILGKEKDFYIGVPGVFYEREKMVAMMFGFEAFECEGGVAEEGKFGYYLRKVEL